MNYILISVIICPFIGFICTITLPIQNKVKEVSFAFSIITFYFSLFLWIFFDNSASSFQFVTDFFWLNTCNYQIRFGIDGISLFFIILTTFLIPLCFLFFWDQNTKNQQDIKYYYSAFLLIEAFILTVFSTLDLVVFYVFFESVLIPIFYIVGIWGTRDRKVRAGYLFFLYTLLGSLFILLGIIIIFIETGTTDYIVLLENTFSFNKQKFLWLAFFLSFATKVPIIPAHIWLPEAHVEAPTGGSVILAGILLKLGTYGFLRFSLPLFPLASIYFRPLIFVISSIAVIYTSITALRQTDIKRVIAYASVAHINLTIAGVFSFSFTGLEGSILQMLSHGVVSGALFFCVGVLYDRYHSRLIKYFSGLTQTIPIFIVYFLIFTIANIGLPGTSSFVGEFLILIGIFSINPVIGFFCGTSLILGGGYALWLFNRIAYGNIKTQYIYFSKDINKTEFFTLFPLVLVTIYIGLYPSSFLEPMHISCSLLTKQIF